MRFAKSSMESGEVRIDIVIEIPRSVMEASELESSYASPADRRLLVERMKARARRDRRRTPWDTTGIGSGRALFDCD